MSYTAPRYRLLARNFAPGFLDTPENDTLPPGASPDAKNCLLISPETQDQVRAVVRRRTGALLVNPVAIASGVPVDSLLEFLQESADGQLLAACNGALSVYDNLSTFTPVSGGGGFTAGKPVRMTTVRNNAFLCDGTKNLRYNGAQGFSVGFVAPTGAPGLADGGASGALPNGLWEGLVCWYDSVMDHESDWSPLSAQVAPGANRARQWTKPAGAPPSNVDNWRIYCRRVDTNEVYYFRVGTVPIATGTFTESIADDARTLPSAAIGDNLPPPYAFAVLQEWNGFVLGLAPNSSMLDVSKQGDGESWNPSNRFRVGAQGDGKAARSIRAYGEEILVQKPRSSYRVVAPNGTLPFQIKQIHSSLGNVSQEAALEVNGWLYAWDEVRGPYRTNTAQWDPLADGRIKTIVKRVNRTVLDQIKIGHYPELDLILWSVPTSSTRRRTLLPYNYVLNRWLPPITGMEYASLSAYTTPAGAIGFYFGDYYGRVYQMFVQEADGPPSGTLIARVISATTGSVTCDFEQSVNADGSVTTSVAPVAFYTTGDGLAGMPYGLLAPDGSWQWGIIQSNNDHAIAVDSVNGSTINPVPVAMGSPAAGALVWNAGQLGVGQWGTSVDTGYTLVIGAIESYWWTPVLDFGDPEFKKISRWFSLQGRVGSPNYAINVDVRLNQKASIDHRFKVTLPVAGLAWGFGKWGADKWGGDPSEAMVKHRLMRTFSAVQFGFSNYLPGQPWTVAAYGLGADPLTSQRVGSV